ncbi:MAG: acyl-CoA dehydrogenase family protein [Actinomycetota bacterium]
MEFTLTAEQELFRESVRDFVTDRLPPERLAEIADGEATDDGLWKEAAALGLAGVSVSEKHGGAGMGFLEEAIVAEELGRGLFPGPFLGTVVLALPALGNSPDLLEEVAAGTRVATLAWADSDGHFDPARPAIRATGTGETWTLTGEAAFVPDLAAADLLVVAAATRSGVGVFAVEGEDAERETLPTVDTTRPLGVLRLGGARGRVLADPQSGSGILADIRTRAHAALAAEAVGIASRVTELAAAYAKEREQFGRAIGFYQAVSHKLADSFIETENARSLALWAAALIDQGDQDPEAAVAASSAKVFAAAAAEHACARAIQTHGGIGFTWEHVLHRYYKRALWIASYLGTGGELRAGVADALLG